MTFSQLNQAQKCETPKNNALDNRLRIDSNFNPFGAQMMDIENSDMKGDEEAKEKNNVPDMGI